MLNNDNVAVEGNRKELILKILALKGECVKEIERKNEFKQKLDHLLFYWKIQKCEFKKKIQFSKGLQDRWDLIDDQHHLELESYKDQIKNLIKQNFDQITQTKADSSILLKSILDQHEHQLLCTYREKHEQKKLSYQDELAHQQLVLQIRKDRDHVLSAIRANFMLKSSEVINHTENQLKDIRIMMEKRIQETLNKMESKKPIEVIERHDKEMQQIRKVLNDKAHDDLDVIESLEAQLICLREKKMKSDRDLNKLWMKNKDLKDPLEKGQLNIILLENKHDDYLKQREYLKSTQKELKFVCRCLQDVKWQYEILFQKYQDLDRETNGYRCKFEHCQLKKQSKAKL